MPRPIISLAILAAAMLLGDIQAASAQSQFRYPQYVFMVLAQGFQWRDVLLLHQLGTMQGDDVRNRRPVRPESVLPGRSAASAAACAAPRRGAPKVGPDCGGAPIRRSDASAGDVIVASNRMPSNSNRGEERRRRADMPAVCTAVFAARARSGRSARLETSAARLS
jgi:hypothetical protein